MSNSQDCPYKREIVSLLLREPYPVTVDAAISLLHFLRDHDLRIGIYTTLNDPDSGSRADLELVAFVFRDISANVQWWADKYRECYSESEYPGKSFWVERFSSYVDVMVA